MSSSGRDSFEAAADSDVTRHAPGTVPDAKHSATGNDTALGRDLARLRAAAPQLQPRSQTARVMTEWCHATSASTVTGAATVTNYARLQGLSGNT